MALAGRLQNATETDRAQHRVRPVTTRETSLNGQTQQNTADRITTSTAETQNTSLRLSGWTACLEDPIVKQFTIDGSSGQLYAFNPVGGHRWECQFILSVQSDYVVRFQIHECRNKVVFQYSEHYSTIWENKNKIVCRYTPRFHVLYSMTDTVMLTFYMYKTYYGANGGASISLSFSAVKRSERQHLELQRIELSSTAGYIQTPGFDGSVSCSQIAQSCITLTRPPDHIIFLSRVSRQRVAVRPILTFLGPCGSRLSCLTQRRRHPHPLLFFPDDFGNGARNESHLSLFVYHSNTKDCSPFKLRFSFLLEKPHRVPELNLWNCSRSVWPDLYGHFPCDFKPQCAEQEDESHCPYTSDRCGPGKIDARGEGCYIYVNKRHHDISRAAAKKECQELGASLVSMETEQELEAFSEVMKYNTYNKFWVGTTTAAYNKGKTSWNNMYTNTFFWESSVLVLFLPVARRYALSTNGQLGCLVMDTYTNGLDEYDCRKSRGSSICELPPLPDYHHSRPPVTLPVPSSTTMTGVHLEECPMQHLTHELLACDVESRCRGLENTETWYRAACSMSQGLTQPYFYCDIPGEFVPYTLVCNFREDCSNGCDEDFCQHIPCEQNMIDCGQGQCVDRMKNCDGFKDCITNKDESTCRPRFPSYNEIRPPAVVNFDTPGGFTVTPLPENTSQCPDTHFQCHDGGYCLPVYVRCNDMIDCPGHEDELGCFNFYRTCPGLYRCRYRDQTICLHVNHLCDGLPQCPQHDDELMCNIPCPEACVCYGLAFTCNQTFHISSFPQIRYLDVSGSGARMSDITDNIMLIHLGVTACGWQSLTEVALPNLHSLDLSQNLLHSVNFNHFAEMPHLRSLNLAGNPLSDGNIYVQVQYSHPSLVMINISHVQIESVNMSVLSAVMPKLQVLDLSWNDIKVLEEQLVFHNLQVLNLQGCPVIDFAPAFMKHLTDLLHVLADNFKLCCSVVLPDSFRGECVAPSDEISSCDDLLKSMAYRCALGGFAVLAVLGNLSGFVYRLYILPKNTKTGFLIFIIHLCASDFLMGMYLIFIGVADRTYAGTYIWNDTIWKKSSACSIAGFFSLLSSEVSAFLICFITLDRFLVLRFPFSHIRFGARSAHIACAIIWALGLVMASVPLLPVVSHWEFFHQTGICIPLPVTRANFPGHIYSFGIMIICNLILFMTIGVGQFLIYCSVRSNALADHLTQTEDKGNKSVQSKESTIARRLLSIAVSDFLCWFPIGLCGVLAANGVAIPGEVNVGLAIFVLPLNSALNPFLYTLSIILEKRRKVRELRFQKQLSVQLNG